MTTEQLIEDIESMKQAAKTMLYTKDISQDGYNALVLAYDAWIERVKNCSIPDVSNFVLLVKPNYKAKDGTIKRGIKIDGKYYAPQNDC